MLTHSPDDSTSHTQIFPPTFRAPPLKQCFERNFRLRVQAIIAKQTVVRGERKNNLRWASDEVTACFLAFHGTKYTQEIYKHDAMSQFRLVIQTIYFSPIFWNRSKWKDVIEIHTEGGVDIVNESFDTLLGALIERDDYKRRATAAYCLIYRLIEFDGGAAVARGCHNNM